MSLRLTKARRLWVGRLLAMSYLFCVLAPGISFAVAGEQMSAPCLADDGLAGGTVHVHGAGDMHMHADSTKHVHADAGPDLASAEPSAPGHAGQAALPSNTKDGAHKKTGGQCCGLVCVSAIPAAVADIVEPSVLRFVRVFETCRTIADGTPARRYRPPITS